MLSQAEHDAACGWCYLAAINAPKIMVKTVSLMDTEKDFLEATDGIHP